MRNKIISYSQMCQQENTSSLQKGMYFRFKGYYSILLMSRRKNAPYDDKVEDNGRVLIYEGHDATSKDFADPKKINQPEFRKSGKPTENGKFHQAAQLHKKERISPEKVRVYEKIKPGIWIDNGFFYLIDSWLETSGTRKVFKFKLEAIDQHEDNTTSLQPIANSRIIPTEVKITVWKRDKGACTQCGATDQLHFDHIIPYSKGGTSLKPENIQLLCARHNLIKHNKII